jgi:hypothetical protein
MSQEEKLEKKAKAFDVIAAMVQNRWWQLQRGKIQVDWTCDMNEIREIILRINYPELYNEKGEYCPR